MVIQAIFLLDTLDKDINSFSMRVRYVGGVHVQVSFEIHALKIEFRKLVSKRYSGSLRS